MAEKPQDNPLADTVGALVTAAQRGDLDAVREAAQQIVDVIDAPEEEEPKEPTTFKERFNAALDAKAAS
jgi:hypothetical protein